MAPLRQVSSLFTPVGLGWEASAAAKIAQVGPAVLAYTRVVPSTAEPSRIRFWRPDTPSVTGMLRLEQEVYGRTTCSEHFTVVVVYAGEFDSWYRGSPSSPTD